MTPSLISARVVVDRLDWAERMVTTIRSLPLADEAQFFADERNVWTADSCLRRALESLFDLGRHILARTYGGGFGEYKEVAALLGEKGVLSAEETELLKTLAGYRNRLVHFYHEVSQQELFNICARYLGDIDRIIAAYRRLLQANPDKINTTL